MRKTKPVKKAKLKSARKPRAKKAAKAVAGRRVATPLTQLSAKVTPKLKTRAKSFAKNRGLKIGHLITESLTAYMDQKAITGEANANA
jgi:hypothetical protein